jgi:TolB-like protein
MAADLSFAGFELRLRERQLVGARGVVPLGARAFDLLATLAEKSGQLVSKSDLMDAVWPGLVVEENNLQVHICTLRKLFGNELIATVSGQGYRFTGPVQRGATSQSSASSPSEAKNYSRASRSLAVLPFVNLNDDPDQDYFSDGLAEDVIAKLTRSRWLFVIARSSSFSLARSTREPQEVTRQLDCRYLVSGSVRRSGRTLHIAAELSDGRLNQSLWAERFDVSLDDALTVQDTIASHIVSAIEPVYLRQQELSSREIASRELSSRDVSAAGSIYWDYLMQARWHFWRGSKKHVDLAQQLLVKALVAQPEAAPALALLSFTYMTRIWAGWADNPKEEVIEANRLAMRAVRSDESDAFAHFTLGTALSFTPNLAQAIASLEHSLTLYPQFAAAAGELGRLLAFAGRTDEAAEYVLQAIDASPHDPHLSLWVRSSTPKPWCTPAWPPAKEPTGFSTTTCWPLAVKPQATDQPPKPPWNKPNPSALTPCKPCVLATPSSTRKTWSALSAA